MSCAGVWSGRDKRSGSVVDNFVQEASFQLCYVYRVESTRAVPPIGAGFDTRPAKRLPSRDAPEFVPLMDATPTGHFGPTVFRCRPFFAFHRRTCAEAVTRSDRNHWARAMVVLEGRKGARIKPTFSGPYSRPVDFPDLNTRKSIGLFRTQ